MANTWPVDPGPKSGWLTTSPSGFPIGPQNQVDRDAIQDQLDDQIMAMRRQMRRWNHEIKWANVPGPNTWRRIG